MTEQTDSRGEWILRQVRHYLNETLPVPPRIFTDTTNYMSIDRNDVIDLQGSPYLVRCNEREGRFGIDEQPKFWVKRALALETGRLHILKLAFQEEFKVRIGTIEFKCTRSAQKEAAVLRIVRGDPRFMQGHDAHDSRGNLVRIIEFISGVDLLSYLHSISASHETYFHLYFPGILAGIIDSLGGLQKLHEAGLCHGDIRNDHLLIDGATGVYRWIDFDLTQAFLDFDVWSVGNILHCIAAKGFCSFRDAIQMRPELLGKLTNEDASAFFPHRIMNLGKMYPYIPRPLNEVLLHFSMGARTFYDKISQIVEDLQGCLESLGPVPPRRETSGAGRSGGGIEP